MHELTERFRQALNALHADRDAGQLVDLFDVDATLSKLGVPHVARGKDGARTFWREYRDLFEDIEATFTNAVDGSGSAALEWTSEGTLAKGGRFCYTGVSVLDGDGDAIVAFRTYYDPSVFLDDRRMH